MARTPYAVAALVFSALTIQGCFTSRLEYALYSEDHQIEKKDAYDSDLRKHLGGLKRGAAVSGQACVNALFGFIALPPGFRYLPRYEDALKNALEDSNGRFDALAPAELEVTQYIAPPIWRTVCARISGTMVKNAPFSAGSKSLKPRAQHK